MAFVSMYEAVRARGGKVGSRTSIKLLGYAIHKMKKNKGRNRIVFLLSAELTKKTNLAAGNIVDVQYEPTTKECVIIRTMVDKGWKLFTASKTSKALRISIPYIEEYNFPYVEHQSEVPEVHVKNGSIVCKLEFKNEVK